MTTMAMIFCRYELDLCGRALPSTGMLFHLLLETANIPDVMSRKLRSMPCDPHPQGPEGIENVDS